MLKTIPINGNDTYVVSLYNLSLSQKIAISACSGLSNRLPKTTTTKGEEKQTTPVYLIWEHIDPEWLELLYNISKEDLLTFYNQDADEFISYCLENVAGGRIITYDLKTQKSLIPNIITLAGVLDAIPLEPDAIMSKFLRMGINTDTTTNTNTTNTNAFSNSTTTIYDGSNNGTATELTRNSSYDKFKVVFDAVNIFKKYTAKDATEYLHSNFMNNATGGLAWLPPDSPRLIDYLVKERYFNVWLKNGCTPLTKEHKVLKSVVTNNSWGYKKDYPIPIMGYNGAQAVLGLNLFEAETLCIPSVAMGQIATSTTTNLAFFSRQTPITEPLLAKSPAAATAQGEASNTKQEVGAPISYNASKVYVAFVIGDGDNLGYLRSFTKRSLQHRVNSCNNTICKYPLIWTISPQITYLAPDWANWFANQLKKIGDEFALPPSGHTYAYPSLFSKPSQQQFVSDTERDAQLLSTSVSTHWDLPMHWNSAFDNYLPLYSKNNIVKSFLTVNVPYMVPVPAFAGKTTKVLQNKTVVFAPNEWRGTKDNRKDGSMLPFAKKSLKTVPEMAKMINGYRSGTVSAFYITMDDFSYRYRSALSDVFDELANMLDNDRVVIVGGNDLANLALQNNNSNKKAAIPMTFANSDKVLVNFFDESLSKTNPLLGLMISLSIIICLCCSTCGYCVKRCNTRKQKLTRLPQEDPEPLARPIV